MAKFFNNLSWFIKGIKVYALVGKSGTGKSFRAKLIAQKYGIDLIIDDGLLIKGQKIIAGKSAKKELNYIRAIKTALFEDSRHRKEVKESIEKNITNKILVIGTSEKMISKICDRLNLPAPDKIIKIEDISNEEEIKKAMRSRHTEGKHVIPVPSVEISRDYPSLLYESLRIFIKNSFVKKNKRTFVEKTVVTPEYKQHGKVTISEPALAQMIYHCADEFNSSMIIRKVSVKKGAKNYIIKLFIDIPFGAQLSGDLHEFQTYLTESIERYTGIMIEKVDIEVFKMSKKKENIFSKKRKSNR
ncbi:MAG: hypothetical protein JXR63_13645 [Spirochaetales bacterium]|nr:hypothetical protein [Spirochaetales bacterium]